MGTGGSFPGEKGGRGVKHNPPPTSAKVKRTYIYPSTAPYASTVLVKHTWPLSLKNAVVWDATPRGSCKNRRFGGNDGLYHQGGKNRRGRNVKSSY
jgi:hypothetical protein